MPTPVYDVIVLGMGAMGSSACYHLAKRGLKALGIEQFGLGHDLGSSHGESRIIRKAYYEHPDYVPLLQRAYVLWRELEQESGLSIFVQNGLVTYAKPETSEVFRGTLASAEKYHLPIERMTPKQALEKFPLYQPPPESQALFEAEAGFLRVENALDAHVKLAQKYGASVVENEKVLDIKMTDTSVTVTTANNTYGAKILVICAGGWMKNLLNSSFTVPLTLHRLILFWFKAERVHEKAPCFVFHLDDAFYYGFPMLDGRTIKIASHFSRDEIKFPHEKKLDVVPADKILSMQKFIKKALPHVSSELDRFSTCIYSMTPDEHFVIDRHPGFSNVVFAAGFSGHGFKFSSVVGEILADLATQGKTARPIDFLKLDRFQNPQ